MSTIDRHLYRHDRGVVSFLRYHFIWVPRRRRPVLIGAVADRLEALLQTLTASLDLTIVHLAIQPDHLHLFLAAAPTWAPAQIAFRLKGATARVLRQEFLHLRRMPSMWTTSYFCSSAGQVAAATIAAYIQAQSTRS
jgi:putative transposase